MDKTIPKINFQPLWDWIVIDPKPTKVTEGGLHLPEGMEVGDTMKSLVVASGPGQYKDNGTHVPNPVKVGDYVFHLTKRMPNVLIIDGKKYLAIPGCDVLGIVPRTE